MKTKRHHSSRYNSALASKRMVNLYNYDAFSSSKGTDCNKPENSENAISLPIFPAVNRVSGLSLSSIPIIVNSTSQIIEAPTEIRKNIHRQHSRPRKTHTALTSPAMTSKLAVGLTIGLAAGIVAAIAKLIP